MAEPGEIYRFIHASVQLNKPALSVPSVCDEVLRISQLDTTELRKDPYTQMAFADFLVYLNRGTIRAAEPVGSDRWQVNSWVKSGILMGMRLGGVHEMSGPEDVLHFTDRPALPTRPVRLEDSIRIVPGGASARAGSYLGDGVVLMPPSYVNIGAYVDSGTMVDSNALVGSCAQVGKNVHISMGAMIGGVLEPPQAMPCIVGDDAVMFGNSQIAEGVRLGRRVVLGANATITSSTEVIDLVKDTRLELQDGVLVVPEDAVVIPGVGPFRNNPVAERLGVLKQIAVIVKYRDSKTDAKTALESALR